MRCFGGETYETRRMNFSFVSIPFCYVIATLIGVEDKFTIFYLISLIGGILLAMIIPRIPPLMFADFEIERTIRLWNCHSASDRVY